MSKIEEMLLKVRKDRMLHPMYGGTYKVHYIENGRKYHCFVEAYSADRKRVRESVIREAKNEECVEPEWITRIEKYA